MRLSYKKHYTLSEDGDRVFTMIDPMVGGEPLDMMKIYTVAIGEIHKHRTGWNR